MSKQMLAGFLVGMVACVACNGDSSSSGNPPADPFLGTWSCAEQLTVMFTMPQGFPAQNRTDTSTLSITGSGGKLTASKVSDSGANCSLSFTSNGSNGTLDEGQTCTREGISLSYKTGSATVSGSALNTTFSFEATGMVPVGGMMVPAMATGTQDSTCSRLSPPPGGGGATTGGW
jgi:hypothetical protein